jgi:hypothetical protein
MPGAALQVLRMRYGDYELLIGAEICILRGKLDSMVV